MKNLIHKRYELPPGCNCKEIVMRETCGLDEQRVGRILDGNPNAVSVLGEMVRASVVSVDGETVNQPYFDLDKWNTRTRNCLIEFYNDLNDTGDEAVALAKKASAELSPEDVSALYPTKEQ